MAACDSPIEIVDLGVLIAAINPAYFEDGHCGSYYGARIHNVQFCNCDRTLYVIYADAFVFYSTDGFRSLRELHEVNYDANGLVKAGSQYVDAIVDTLRGTVLLIGRDTRDGEMVGVAWRKESGEDSFRRIVCASPAWASSKSGNAAAGFFGAGATEMVVVAIYATPAHLYFSIDDGLSFCRSDLSNVFREHVHQVYLPRATNLHRTARLWVTGGDDPTGERSGVVTFNSISGKGVLDGLQWVIRERPGYRFVALAGNGKHVFIGNESLSGGVIKILDNQQTIDQCDFEYALGKSRHDYHQFRSLVATVDGLLVSGTDSYAYTGDTIRADSGGHLYLSNDGGASYREISLGAKWSTCITYDERSFWVAFSMNREDGADAALHRLSLLRIPKPGAFAQLSSALCVKALIVDSSGFYRMAGYTAHPRASLAPGECTLRVDLSACRSVVIDIETHGPAQIAVEGRPFQNWHPDEDPWQGVASIAFEGAERKQLQLGDIGLHNRHFRLRNAGSDIAEIRFAMFVSKY